MILLSKSQKSRKCLPLEVVKGVKNTFTITKYALEKITKEKCKRKFFVSNFPHNFTNFTSFRKLQRSDLICRLGCDLPESQFHIFTECKYGEFPPNPVHGSIFSDETRQKEVIQVFIKIEKRRLKLLEHVPPGETRV